MQICVEVLVFFEWYGVFRNVIVFGFGMIEICVGCIYSISCLDYDFERGYFVVLFGICICGMEM